RRGLDRRASGRDVPRNAAASPGAARDFRAVLQLRPAGVGGTQRRRRRRRGMGAGTKNRAGQARRRGAGGGAVLLVGLVPATGCGRRERTVMPVTLDERTGAAAPRHPKDFSTHEAGGRGWARFLSQDVA